MPTGSTASQLEGWQGTSRVTARRKSWYQGEGVQESHAWVGGTALAWKEHLEKKGWREYTMEKCPGSQSVSVWLSAHSDKSLVPKAGGEQCMSTARNQMGHNRQGALARGGISRHRGNPYKNTHRSGKQFWCETGHKQPARNK